MTEHYCDEHNCKFYENTKGDKTWYSHKIKGTDKYCNEQKKDTPASHPSPTPATKAELPTIKENFLAVTEPASHPNDNAYWEKKQAIERVSIERQVAAKIAFERGINENGDTLWTVEKALQQAEQIYQWIHFGDPATKFHAKQEDKPLETQPGGKLPHASTSLGINEEVDKEMLINSIKSRMKFRGEAANDTAMTWLTNVNKIPAERIENESDVVYQEMKTKYNWS